MSRRTVNWRWTRGLVLLLLAVAMVAAAAIWLLNRPDAAEPSSTPLAVTPALIERGAYLARAGNCMGCHTQRGGTAYAGGRPIPTPFGSVFATNLTPDPQHGLGLWSADDFWNALHNGRSRDGRLLSPAFPYTNYSLVSRADADALYAYLRSLPAAALAVVSQDVVPVKAESRGGRFVRDSGVGPAEVVVLHPGLQLSGSDV